MERFRRFVKLVAIGLVVAALIEQLRRDSDDRTWEGAVAGIVPYDFRAPTFGRARSRIRPRPIHALGPATGILRRHWPHRCATADNGLPAGRQEGSPLLRREMFDLRLRAVRLGPDASTRATEIMLADPILQLEAICLKTEVDRVIGLVDHHLTMMEPQNVVGALAAIANGQTPTGSNQPPATPPAAGQPGGGQQPATPQSVNEKGADPTSKLNAMTKLLKTAIGDLSDLDLSPDQELEQLTQQVSSRCDS